MSKIISLSGIVIAIFHIFGSLYTAESAGGSYYLRISHAHTCDHSNTTYVMKNIAINRHNNQDYLNAEVDLLRDVTGANMTVEIEKCDKSGGKCERLTNFRLNDFCRLFKMKNTFWYSMVDAIHPRPDCPALQKGIYHLHNGTMNANDLVKLDPDSPKYHWKLKAMVHDTEGKEIICGTGEGYIEQ